MIVRLNDMLDKMLNRIVKNWPICIRG